MLRFPEATVSESHRTVSRSHLFRRCLVAAFGLLVGGVLAAEPSASQDATQSLNLARTNVTDAGVAELQKALPECEIAH